MKLLQLVIVLIGFFANAGALHAEDDAPFKMSFPVNCELHKDCWLLYYVDVNRTKGEVEDYSCGKRSYDQHKGTDIVIRDSLAMNSGIDVLAAAPGEVLRLRDGIEDSFKTAEEKKAIQDAGIECGNGVFIDHGNGFQTQYCHLKKESVIVKKGQMVKRGEKIGQVGISGFADHPHLHLSVYKDRQLIDPFMGLDVQQDCNKKYYTKKTYWDETFPPRNDSPMFYDSGFSTAVPKFKQIPQGKKGAPPTVGAKALVFWVAMFDIRLGDYITLKIVNAEGEVVASNTISQDADKIRQYYAVGKKMRKGLNPGTYIGQVALTRVMDDGNTQTYRHQDVFALQ